MKPLLVAAVFSFFFSASTSAQANRPSQDESVTCRVSPSTPGYFENDALGVTLPEKFTFRPGGSGFVDTDGSLGMKVGWQRKRKGQLEVSGKRLDGSAPPARAYIYDYGDTGFQPIYLVFPAPGCWEITGAVSGGRLTFVTLVEKIGDGPAWRFEGLERGWRVSGGVVQSQVPPNTSLERTRD